MDHMRISGYGPSSSDPSPNKVVSKVENVDPKVPKHIYIYTQTKVKQHHIFSETLFWKLQNGICG